MPTSAADVISYIGIPLAVLGVLPILYTVCNGFVTLLNIRRICRRNHLAAVTRGSFVTGFIEVEMPRWSITPFERDEPEYWTLNPHPSGLRGGSWTLFHWNQIITGRRTYRIQYSDEIQEPQAEVDFEELLAFLMDRGALPDAKGFHLLKLAGLFTPVGTSLLLSPDQKNSVLRVSLPDDSDGILSLSLNWRPAYDERNSGSLPPYWMVVHDQPTGGDSGVKEVKKKEEDAEDAGTVDEETPIIASDSKDPTLQPPTDAPDPSRRSRSPSAYSRTAHPKDDTAAICFRLGVRVGQLYVQQAAWGRTFLRSRASISLPPTAHLAHPTAPAARWFTSAAVALGLIRRLALWTCHIPEPVVAFAARETLPCGVLEEAGVLTDDETPPWATRHDPHEDAHASHRRFVQSAQRAAVERTLPPAQAEAARRIREADERDAFFQQSAGRAKRDRERRELRDQEALKSPRLETGVVARAAAGLLARQVDGFDRCGGVEQVAEKVLFKMVAEPELGTELAALLDRWEKWAERGGMTLEDLDYCRQHAEMLCYAICLVAVIHQSSQQEAGTLALDLQDVIRAWQKVRLG